jgi:hypothetical protein
MLPVIVYPASVNSIPTSAILDDPLPPALDALLVVDGVASHLLIIGDVQHRYPMKGCLVPVPAEEVEDLLMCRGLAMEVFVVEVDHAKVAFSGSRRTSPWEIPRLMYSDLTTSSIV